MIITLPNRRPVVRVFAAAAIAAVLACAPSKSATKAVDSAAASAAQVRAVHDSVSAMLTDFVDKMSNGGLEGAGMLYSSDTSFYWIESGSLRFQNTAELRKSLLTLKSIPQIKMTLYETRIDVLSPTIASVRTEFSQGLLSGTGKGDTYGGYMTILVVRESDGWRMRNGHTSSRRPRPGM
ncbi:MAG: hypothetical protein ABI120_26025 [Gemmatimonadaceae bacterium]